MRYYYYSSNDSNIPIKKVGNLHLIFFLAFMYAKTKPEFLIQVLLYNKLKYTFSKLPFCNP